MSNLRKLSENKNDLVVMSRVIDLMQWGMMEAIEMLISSGARSFDERGDDPEDRTLEERALRNLEIALREAEMVAGYEH